MVYGRSVTHSATIMGISILTCQSHITKVSICSVTHSLTTSLLERLVTLKNGISAACSTADIIDRLKCWSSSGLLVVYYCHRLPQTAALMLPYIYTGLNAERYKWDGWDGLER